MRRIRIAAAALFLLTLSTAFFIQNSWVVLPAKLQIGPNLAALANHVWTAAIVLGIFAALTFLGGRWYCAVFCPFGILQDLAIGMRRLFFPRSSAKLTVSNHPYIRWGVTLFVLGGLFAELALPFSRLEPFTLYGDILNGLIRPIAVNLNNYFFPENPFAVRPAMHWGILTGGIILFAIIALSLLKKRMFCTTLCPVGTLLGSCARHAHYAMRLDSERCIHCNRCVTVCPTNCVDPRNGSIDAERCVNCFNCHAACPKDAIRYGKKAKLPENPVSADRRKFFSTALFSAGAGLLAGETLKLVPAEDSPSEPIVPPGAGSRQRFAANCTGCQLCVAVCTGNVLRPAALDFGAQRAGQVHLAFDKGMCEFNCNNCSQICPSGAIRPLTLKEKRRTRIGLAVYNPDLCIAVVYGTECGACSEHCPTGALQMTSGPKLAQIPKLIPSLCIGCGSCEYACPVRPTPAIRVHAVTQCLAEDPDEYFRKQKKAAPAAQSDEWAF